jgi:transposase
MTDTAPLPPRLLSVRSVARELDCSTSKIKTLIARERREAGTGLRSVKVDGNVRVLREDLEEWLSRWLGKSTGSESTEASGASSGDEEKTNSAMRSASRRQRAIGRMASARSRAGTAA